MKKLILFLCLSVAILVSSCIVSVNTTHHSGQPTVINSFDLSSKDFVIIRPVSYTFRATYVIGIGGWKSRRINAVQELCAMADLTKNQQVVNITSRTFVNFILGALVVRRETTAEGLLIEFTNGNNINTVIAEENISEEQENNQIEEEIKPQREVVDLTAFDEQTKNDMYYIAYLVRTQLLDIRYQREIAKKYDMAIINQLATTYSDSELKTLSKDRSKKVRQYRLP